MCVRFVKEKGEEGRYTRMHVYLHAASPSVARGSVTRVVRRDRGVLELRRRRLAEVLKSQRSGTSNTERPLSECI